MNVDLQLKLQAYLDGELPPGEAREVVDWLARDADACALLGELQNTRHALTGYEADLKLPEAREFYWSKIQRAILRLEKSPPVTPALSWFVTWRRLLVPAGAFAALVLAVVVLASQLGLGRHSGEAEFALTDDTSSFTYRDYASGTTLVWLPYEAENEFAEMDTEDTIQ